MPRIHARPRTAGLLLGLATLVIGCDVRPPTADQDADTAEDAAVSDTGADATPIADAGAAADLAEADLGGEDCPGGPNCPCQENAECDSALCIQTPAGKRCARKCVEDCPGAFACAQVPSGGDIANICVPKYGRLCDPCTESKACAAIGLTGAFCVDYGDDGAFCGLQCHEDADCGNGYHCNEASSIEGKKAKQCVRFTTPGEPVDCPCTPLATLTSLKTTCYLVTKDARGKEAGKCTGERICGDEGLSVCTAPEPKPEVCDGDDNDCNGEVDEGTCNDDNPCTKDACAAIDKPDKDGPKAECKHDAWSGPCDADGTACTEGDACIGGVCKVGKTLDCDDANQCTTDGCDPKVGCKHDFPESAGCDDGNPCSEGAVCAFGTCKAGQTKTCDPGNACVLGKCDFKTGNCVFEEVSDKTVCDDGNACTELTACTKGVCKGQPKDCDDGNPCTDSVCDTKKGCVLNDNVKPCDDGNACTKDDTCLGGVCKTNPVHCDDGKPCTKDSCDPGTKAKVGKGCAHVVFEGGCDADGDACTVGDKCIQGICAPGPRKLCHDGSECTVDRCDAKSGVCKFDGTKTEGLSCNADSSVCTVGDTCRKGTCTAGKSKVCDDGEACTVDACDPKQGCRSVKSSGPCDADGNACTVGDTCDEGKCVVGKLKGCDDHTGCTKDSCDPGTGACKHDGSFFEGQPCDADGSTCTVGDRCTSGQCMPGKKKNCDDGDPCTDDECSNAKGCTNTYNKAPCNADDNPCTKGDRCVDGKCKVGLLTDCRDDNPCTIDSCIVAKGGCVHDGASKDGALCDADGSVCSEVDKCQGGACRPGPLKKCVDGNPCTDDRCDKLKGCVFSDNTDPCSDGKNCTIGDRCKAGKCWPGLAKGCGDNNPCTQDQCDDQSGKCAYLGKPMDGQPCNKDDSICTVGDKCVGGACEIGVKTDCNDGNGCTIDSCHSTLGCRNVASQGACSDGSKCTTNDVCKGGKCVAQPITCDDGKVCTTDSCDPKKGCVFAADRELRKCGDYSVCFKDVCTKVKCGDVQVHRAVEKCDLGNLDGKDCGKVLGNESWGILGCAKDCQSFDVSKCHDLSWMERTDKCGGFRQASLFPTVRFAISKSTTWDKDKVYECPKGYHWASTAEGKALFVGKKNGDDVYWNKCGWHGMIWKGAERKILRFSDSAKTGAYKHTAFPEGAALQYDGTTSWFAGLVCIKGGA